MFNLASMLSLSARCSLWFNLTVQVLILSAHVCHCLAILNMNLHIEQATKQEIRALKQFGVLGKRAPSCTLLNGLDMMKLLKAFGKNTYAELILQAMCKAFPHHAAQLTHDLETAEIVMTCTEGMEIYSGEGNIFDEEEEELEIETGKYYPPVPELSSTRSRSSKRQALQQTSGLEALLCAVEVESAAEVHSPKHKNEEEIIPPSMTNTSPTQTSQTLPFTFASPIATSVPAVISPSMKQEEIFASPSIAGRKITTATPAYNSNIVSVTPLPAIVTILRDSSPSTPTTSLSRQVTGERVEIGGSDSTSQFMVTIVDPSCSTPVPGLLPASPSDIPSSPSPPLPFSTPSPSQIGTSLIRSPSAELGAIVQEAAQQAIEQELINKPWMNKNSIQADITVKSEAPAEPIEAIQC